MRTLVLGGTSFLSAAVAQSALDAGHEVVCLARGETGGFPLGCTPVVADRRWGSVVYSALEGSFDSVIDVATRPAFVIEALTALASRAGHWTYVSSCSVYARHDEPWADESAGVVDPLDDGDPDAPADFAGLKSRSELACREALGDRVHIVRPGLIIGPADPSDRFGYWPARLRREPDSPVVVPDDPDAVVQMIDVRDVAEWILRCAEREVVGVHNVTGPSVGLVEVLESIADVCEFTGEFVPVSPTVLREHGVTYWSGPDSLPLWIPSGGDLDAFGRRDASAAWDAGLDVRRMAESTRDVLDDEVARGVWRERRAGLSSQSERRLLDEVS